MRSIPLRLKLVVALVLPMMIVAVLVGERVTAATNDRRVASAQEAEAIQLAAVAQFADAVAAEAVAINDVTTTPEQLAAHRAATDEAIDSMRSPAFGLDTRLLQTLQTRYAELTSMRATLGDDPSETNVLYQQEIWRADSPQFDGVDPALAPGTVSRALIDINQLPGEVIEEFEFDDGALVDVQTTRLLSDYGLVQRYRADHSRELSAMLRLSSTPTIVIDVDLIDQVGASIQRSDDSLRLIDEFGTPELAARVDGLQESVPSADYRSLRLDAAAAVPGQQPLPDSIVVNDVGAVVTQQYAALADDVLGELRSEADGVVDDATRSLILSVLVGLWVIVLTALLLRFLYRAIKSPIERLTEQSRQIASVELPEVVAAMRRGDTDAVPEIEELVAESDDEIGELVHAFNEMHRTAVGLAAEQAGSRRIVADMFVNLGRRNQRLINRLLKRLTALEQDERDPDKLAGLYEIDHVATRMRRNAESLLVLAGASQSRRWNHPVDVYDIARGALSEVEGYERVLVDTDEDLEIHGDVVADLTHLLAELVENALAFSPPETAVEVCARKARGGSEIIVTDRGVGMTDEQLAEANERIRSAAHDTETPSEFLGHYVVGRLAARHDIVVDLAHGESSGTVAVVRLPTGAVVPGADELVEEFETAMNATEQPVPADSPVVVEMPSAGTIAEQPTRVPAAAAPPSVTMPTPAAPSDEASVAVPSAAGLGATARTTDLTPLVPAPSSRRATPSDLGPAPLSPPRASGPDATPSLLESQPVRTTSRDRPIADLVPDPDAAPQPAPPTAREQSLADLAVTPITAAPLSASAPIGLAAPTAPRPAAVPNADLASAQASASEAVDAALSMFGAERRTPGANLPDTSLVSSLSGVMSLDTSPTPAAPPSPRGAPSGPDPDEIRFQLAGFQSGTRRADQED